jgi:hypothetical protein
MGGLLFALWTAGPFALVVQNILVKTTFPKRFMAAAASARAGRRRMVRNFADSPMISNGSSGPIRRSKLLFWFHFWVTTS